MRREHDEHVVVDHERPDDDVGDEDEEAEAPPDLDDESRQLEPRQQWQHVARQLEPRDALQLDAPLIPRQVRPHDLPRQLRPLESRQFRLDPWLERRPGERSRQVTEAAHGRGTLRP